MVAPVPKTVDRDSEVDHNDGDENQRTIENHHPVSPLANQKITREAQDK